MKESGNNISTIHGVIVFLDKPRIHRLCRSECNGNIFYNNGFFIFKRVDTFNGLFKFSVAVN